VEKLKNNIATTIVSSMFIVSAFLSAKSVWTIKSNYMSEQDVFFQAGMFVVLGLAVAVGFWSIEEKVKKQKNWIIPSIFALILAVFWLLISPKQNAFELNKREAVVAEIKEQYINIEKTVTPFTERYESYRKIAQNIRSIERKLINMQAEQARTKKGRFYKMLDGFNIELPMITEDFKNSYNRQTDEIIKNIKTALEEINELEYGEKYTDDDKVKLLNANTLVLEYNRSRLKLQSYIAKLKNSDDPTMILKNILDKLQSFQNLVITTQKNTNNDRVKEIATDTLKQINPLVSSFSEKIKQIEKKTKKIQENIAGVDKIVFESITLDVALVDKHRLKYYPMYLGAHLLDLIPIMFVIFRTIMLVRNRKKLYKIAEKETLEKEYNAKLKELENILKCKTKNCIRLEELKKKHAEKEDEKRSTIRELEKEYDKEVDEINDEIDKLTIEIKKRLDELELEQNIKEKEAGDDPSDLQDIKELYDKAKANADRTYDENKIKLQNQEKDALKRYQRQNEHAEQDFDKAINNMIAEMDKMNQKRTIRIANVEEKIAELEVNIDEIDKEIKNIEIKDFKLKDEKSED